MHRRLLVLFVLLSCQSLYAMNNSWSLADHLPDSVKRSIARICNLDKKLEDAVGKGDMQRVEKLIAWGVDVTQNRGLLQNAKSNELFKFLLSHGARDGVDRKAFCYIANKKNPELLVLYCASHDDMNAKDEDSQGIPFLVAFREKWLEGVRIMLQCGVDIDIAVCHRVYGGNVFHCSEDRKSAEFFVTLPQVAHFKTHWAKEINRMVTLQLCAKRKQVPKEARKLLCFYAIYANLDKLVAQHLAYVRTAFEQPSNLAHGIYLADGRLVVQDVIRQTPHELALTGRYDYTQEVIETFGMSDEQLKERYEAAIRKEYVEMLDEKFTSKRKDLKTNV